MKRFGPYHDRGIHFDSLSTKPPERLCKRCLILRLQKNKVRWLGARLRHVVGSVPERMAYGRCRRNHFHVAGF